jgi:2-hydroxy-3-keto-5-methylthiopentenyl-1-phosphate phosphatase
MQNVIAIVYDFDGTLTPLPMQEYTLLPQLGITGTDFWKKTHSETIKNRADGVLTYMRLLLENLKQQGKKLHRSDWTEMGKNIKYFHGVENYFEQINDFVFKESSGEIILRHYLISAGNREIIEGASIFHQFNNVFANEYFYDESGVATFPAMIVNETTKTQFLFRINKGVENIAESVNEYMPEQERPIPFENILYIGDGLTDVPCMVLTRQNHGHALAVYPPDGSQELCRKLLHSGRIDCFAPADYSCSSKLFNIISNVIRVKIASIKLKSEAQRLTTNKIS